MAGRSVAGISLQPNAGIRGKVNPQSLHSGKSVINGNAQFAAMCDRPRRNVDGKAGFHGRRPRLFISTSWFSLSPAPFSNAQPSPWGGGRFDKQTGRGLARTALTWRGWCVRLRSTMEPHILAAGSRVLTGVFEKELAGLADDLGRPASSRSSQ